MSLSFLANLTDVGDGARSISALASRGGEHSIISSSSKGPSLSKPLLFLGQLGVMAPDCDELPFLFNAGLVARPVASSLDWPPERRGWLNLRRQEAQEPGPSRYTSINLFSTTNSIVSLIAYASD